MKKTIIALFICALLMAGQNSVLAIYPEDHRANLSIFSGGYFAKENTNNQGHWYGLYAEYHPIRTLNGFNMGLGVLASNSEFNSNDWTSVYAGSNTEFGIGLVGGKYWEFLSDGYAGYLGANFLIRKSSSIGNGQNFEGKYSMNQEDIILSGELNMNILKSFAFNESIFPRTQLRLLFQTPISSEKEDYWNQIPIEESAIWSKSALAAELKQSINNIELRNESQMQTKLLLGYQFYRGDESHWLVFGPEISLKKLWWDDYISLYFFIKKRTGHYESGLNDTQFVFGINLMPLNFKKY